MYDALESNGCKPKREGKGYKALCPAHDDTNRSLSISTGKSQPVVIHCFAGCSSESILERLGMHTTDLCLPKPKRNKLNLQDLAEDKGLPVDFLNKNGVIDFYGLVKITYYDEFGRSLGCRQRRRTALSAHDGSSWYLSENPDDKIVPYGLRRLDDERKAGSGYLILVEGESDCWTLWYHDFPTLGIPGADCCNILMLEHLAGFDTLFLSKEPGQGGETFILGMTRRLQKLGWKGDIRILTMPDGIKDPNDLHKRYLGIPGEFKEQLQAALDKSTPAPEPEKDWFREFADSVDCRHLAGDSGGLVQDLMIGICKMQDEMCIERSTQFKFSNAEILKKADLHSPSALKALDRMVELEWAEVTGGAAKKGGYFKETNRIRILLTPSKIAELRHSELPRLRNQTVARKQKVKSKAELRSATATTEQLRESGENLAISRNETVDTYEVRKSGVNSNNLSTVSVETSLNTVETQSAETSLNTVETQSVETQSGTDKISQVMIRQETLGTGILGTDEAGTDDTGKILSRIRRDVLSQMILFEVETWSEEMRDWFEERAGMKEYDANLPRPQSEWEAYLLTKSRFNEVAKAKQTANDAALVAIMDMIKAEKATRPRRKPMTAEESDAMVAKLSGGSN